MDDPRTQNTHSVPIEAALLTDVASVPTAAATRRSPAATALLGFSLILVGINLRPVFSSLSVLLPEVRAETGLSTTALGLLTTLPVLCLGVFAPLAPMLARRFGAERVFLAVLLLVSIGTAMRGIDSIATLYIGTAIAGFAIALGNTLLPGVVKREFPGQLALLTGLYSMALCGGAAAGAAFTLPIEAMLIEHGFGNNWRAALAFWAVPALIAATIWSGQLRRGSGQTPPLEAKVKGLMRDPIAWQVTAFMGLQSALAYIVFGWLAPILRLRGMDGVTSGFIVSTLIMMQVAASIFVPLLGARSKDQRGINLALVALAVFGLLGMMFGPLPTIWLFALPQGIGQGGLFAIAMTMIVLRAADARIASQLSGMAQGVGYIVAAGGPLIMGALLQRGDGLVGPAAFIVMIGLCCAAAGLGAGRALFVKTSP